VIALFASTMLFFMINFAFSGDVTKGKTLYTEKLCWHCHGNDGKSANNPKYPRIAGQHKEYLADQIKYIRDKKRDVSAAATSVCRFRMKFMGTVHITDADIEDIAEWLAAQPCN